MKISVITVSYNSEKTIERTIKSVLKQENITLEYIIIDGASNDNTIKIIEKYKNDFKLKDYSYLIKSEPDNGIYDAMNKGIKIASGDIIGILNSDDYYANNDVLYSVISNFERNKIDSVYGDLLYIKNGKPYRYWKSGNYKSFNTGWMPPHPSFFVKRDIYEKYGIFRLDCGINADYEILLRFFEVYKISSLWVNKIFTFMEAGGASNNGIKSRINGINNDKIAWEKNNLKSNYFTIILKKVRKLPQFLMAKTISKKILL